jgi:hypothetical protein
VRIRGIPRRIANRDDESGAALIEFAIGATLLLTLLFGIVEFGLAFRDRLTITNSTQSAARVGSALGNDDQADFEILKSLEQSLGTLPNSGIGIVRYVDVYHADVNGQPLNTCNGGGSNKCNRYLYHPGFTPTCDWNPCPDADDGYTGWGWAPSARDVALPGLDVLGVRITFAHEWVTGGLVPLPNVDCDGSPGAGCWADTAIMRIEPQVFEP